MISYDIASYQMISYDIMWYSIISYDIIYYIIYHMISYITSHHIIWYIIWHTIWHIISYHITYIIYHIIPNHIISYHISHSISHIICILSYPISFIIKLIKTVPQTENTSSIDNIIFIYRIFSSKCGMRWREIYDGVTYSLITGFI